MPDISLVTTAISTTGTLLGALGGVALSNGVSDRRERKRVEQELRDRRLQEKRQAYHGLLSTAAQLKLQIEIAGQGHCRDMDVRLAAMQEQAIAASVHASHIALAAPEAVAGAAQELAAAAGQLAAAATGGTELGYENDKCVGGQMLTIPDFGTLDASIERFRKLAAEDAS